MSIFFFYSAFLRISHLALLVTGERIGTNFLLPNIVPELGIADIACNHPVRSAGQGILCGSKPLCAAGDEHDRCAGCCEGLGDAQADPTRPAGYEYMFAEKGLGGDDGGVEASEELQGGAGDSGNEKHGWFFFYWDMTL